MAMRTTEYRTLMHAGHTRYTVVTDERTGRSEWFTSRAQRRFENQERYKCLRELQASGDKLAYRAFMLQAEGRQTLVNVIFNDHNKPNRY